MLLPPPLLLPPHPRLLQRTLGIRVFLPLHRKISRIPASCNPVISIVKNVGTKSFPITFSYRSAPETRQTITGINFQFSKTYPADKAIRMPLAI